jgi:hypothetical protein
LFPTFAVLVCYEFLTSAGLLSLPFYNGKYTCPGRDAVHSTASLSRDPWLRLMGPGSAAHHFVLRSVRGTNV